MSRKIRMIGVGLLLLLLTMAVTGCGYSSNGDKAVFGGSETIRAGEVVEGDLAIFGGTVVIEEGAEVAGDLAVLGGTVTLDGTIRGDVANIGGTVTWGENSRVEGEIANVGGTTRPDSRTQAPEAPEPPVVLDLPAVQSVAPSIADRIFALFGGIVSMVLKTIAFGVLGLILTLFLPDHVRRVSHAAGTAPAASLGIGCLTLPAVIVLMVITAITIVGLPLTALLGAAWAAAMILGWIGLGLFVGDRLLRAVDIRSPRPPAAAAIGSGGLVLTSSVLGILPFFGWLVTPILAFWALGATVLTRGGTQEYPHRPRLDAPVPSPTLDPLAGVAPSSRPESSPSSGGSGNLFADLAADLGIEDELYGDEEDNQGGSGRETPVTPPDEE